MLLKKSLSTANQNFLSLERTAKHYADLMDVWLRFREVVRTAPALSVSRLVQSGCQTKLTPEILAAYEAPFPDPSYAAAVCERCEAGASRRKPTRTKRPASARRMSSPISPGMSRTLKRSAFTMNSTLGCTPRWM